MYINWLYNQSSIEDLSSPTHMQSIQLMVLVEIPKKKKKKPLMQHIIVKIKLSTIVPTTNSSKDEELSSKYGG